MQFVDPDDAAEAKYEMDGQVFLGRELTVVFAEENRKKPSEMRARERIRSREFLRSSLCFDDLLTLAVYVNIVLISNKCLSLQTQDDPHSFTSLWTFRFSPTTL